MAVCEATSTREDSVWVEGIRVYVLVNHPYLEHQQNLALIFCS